MRQEPNPLPPCHTTPHISHTASVWMFLLLQPALMQLGKAVESPDIISDPVPGAGLSMRGRGHIIHQDMAQYHWWHVGVGASARVSPVGRVCGQFQELPAPTAAS